MFGFFFCVKVLTLILIFSVKVCKQESDKELWVPPLTILKRICCKEPTAFTLRCPCFTTVVMVVCKRYAAIARELDRQHRADIVYINFSRSEGTHCSTSVGDVKCTVNVIKSFLFISCLHYPDSSNYTL